MENFYGGPSGMARSEDYFLRSSKNRVFTQPGSKPALRCHPINVRSSPCKRTSARHHWMSQMCRYCCKSRFAQAMKNSAARTFGFRVRMRGTSSPHIKRTGDFGNATEGIRIGDQFPSCVFAKNSEPRNFRLLQHYLPEGDLSRCNISSRPRARS